MGDVRMQALPSLKDVLTPATEGSVTIQGFATKEVVPSQYALPLFPLRLLPMPGETIGLHVFEQRYQVLFNDLEAMHVDEFGIPFLTTKRSGALAPP